VSCTPACHNPTPSQAHCGACHRTLGSVTEFDRHRRGGACIDPQTLGLVEARQVWASPERHQRDSAGAERLAMARSRVAQPGTETRTGESGPDMATKINYADLSAGEMAAA